MADKITLALENRTVIGKKVNRLRRAGILPATVYGKGVGPFSVQMDARMFSSSQACQRLMPIRGCAAKGTHDEVMEAGTSVVYQESILSHMINVVDLHF